MTLKRPPSGRTGLGRVINYRMRPVVVENIPGKARGETFGYSK